MGQSPPTLSSYGPLGPLCHLLGLLLCQEQGWRAGPAGVKVPGRREHGWSAFGEAGSLSRLGSGSERGLGWEGMHQEGVGRSLSTLPTDTPWP